MNATANKGLGKGLSALMGESYSQTMTSESNNVSSIEKNFGYQSLSTKLLHGGKFQPRTRFDEEYLNELADSIEKNGIMQPIIVRPSPKQQGSYEIIAGERRWRAAQLANLAQVPVIIRDVEDQLALELALVENIQRKDLTALEEASGYQRLMDEFGYTQETLARTVGKSRSHIANLLRLLDLPTEIKTLMDQDQLTMGHARALLTASNPVALAKQVVKEQLNVRQTEILARGEDVSANLAISPPNTAKTNAQNTSPATHQSRATTSKGKDPDIIALEETLSDNLGLGVSINDLGSQKGEVIIQYGSLAQLDDILRRLGESI